MLGEADYINTCFRREAEISGSNIQKRLWSSQKQDDRSFFRNGCSFLVRTTRLPESAAP